MKPLRPLELPLTGVQLIEASAGTGKTYTITTLVLRLLLERKLGIHEVVVVTFTKAATAELRARVRQRLRQTLDAVTDARGLPGDALLEKLLEGSTQEEVKRRLTQALQAMDEASIFTIHGFCQRVLLEFAFESKLRFDSELLLDQRPLILEIVQDFWAREVPRMSEAEVRFLQSVGVNLQELSSLAATAINWPDTPIVAHEATPETAPQLERYLIARRQAASIYRLHGAEIRALLENSVALNRRSYNADTLARWFTELEELFASNSESLDAHTEAVGRLSRSTLTGATKLGQKTPSHSFFETCEWLEKAHTAAIEAFENWLVEFKLQLVSYARREAQRRKLDRGLLSFDDLLSKMAQALSGPRGETLAKLVREKYPAALIDEFQDTDPVQYQVFSRIYGKASSTLFLIGDPKQAIYGFRGADVFAYLAAVTDAGRNTWTLDTNYRSDKSLVAALNAFFGHPHNPFLLEGIAYSKVQPRPDASDALKTLASDPAPSLEVLFVERGQAVGKQKVISKRWAELHLPEWIAADIARLLASDTTLDEKRIRPSDIAVLTRTNLQAAQVGQALGELGIPSALVGDSSVFDSGEASEMRLMLRAMAEPTSAGALRSALCTPSLGVSIAELSELSSNESAWERWVELFRSLNTLWERRGFIRAIQTLFRERQVSARTLMLPSGERRLTNLRHLTELIHQAETDMHLGIAGLVLWFDDIRFNPSAREGMAPEAQQLRLESDEHAVQLTTMHKSKGLEYPIVYLPHLWRDAGLFPQEIKHLKVHDASNQQKLTIDLRTPDNKRHALEAAGREALAENLRLCYVAMTRAKHRTVLVWGAFKNAEDSPLGYLMYQPPEELGALSEAPRPRIQNLSDSQLRATLKRYEELTPGAFALRALAPTPSPAYAHEQARAASFRVRKLSRSIDVAFKISSFSQLSRASHALSVVASVGKDVDEAPELMGLADDVPSQEPTKVPLSEFPRGARAGELLHSILEHVDFADPTDLAGGTRTELVRHGLEPTEWLEVVVAALEGVLNTELEPSGLKLSSIKREKRISEMEFTLPARNWPSPDAAPSLITPESLSQVFATHATSLSDAYQSKLRSLDFAPLRGFLRGFIDLVFEYEGRYFVVDYKSNHLGTEPGDYAPSKLVAPMEDHHYYLQYHLYVAALDRYLEARLRDYDYERHFGGVYYLFLRGMDPSFPSRSGVFYDRPPAQLTHALVALFAGEERSP